MRVPTYAAAILGAMAVAGASGCGAAGDPLGGPYGGTAAAVSPMVSAAGASEEDADGSTDGALSLDSSLGSTCGSVAVERQTGAASELIDAAIDAEARVSPDAASAGSSTWTMIFDTYLAGGTVGDCIHCHQETSSPASAYAWLSGKQYINGTKSLLAGSGSCLSWFCGDMPPGGPASDPAAASDLKSWVAAGAQDN